MTVRLFIVAGQSNAIGYGMSPATLPAHLATMAWGQTYVKPLDSPWWGVLDPGVNTGANGMWGGWVETAYQLRVAYPNDVLLFVLSAQGSTGVAVDGGAADWSPQSAGELFDLTTARVESARATLSGILGDLGPATVLWRGGETDAYDAWKAASHFDFLPALIDASRAAWGADHWIIARLNAPMTPYVKAVRAAEMVSELDDPLVSGFATDGFALQADNLHDAAAAHVAIGQGFFHAYMEL